MEYIGDIKPIGRFNVPIANGFLPKTANMFLENYHSFLSLFFNLKLLFLFPCLLMFLSIYPFFEPLSFAVSGLAFISRL